MSRPNPPPSSRRQKWGSGSSVSIRAQRARGGETAESSRDEEAWDGDFGPANDGVHNCGGTRAGGDDDDNPFESIGKALDARERDARTTEDAAGKVRDAERTSRTSSLSADRGPSTSRRDRGRRGPRPARLLDVERERADAGGRPTPSERRETPAPRRLPIARRSLDAQKSRSDKTVGRVSRPSTMPRGASTAKKTPRLSFRSLATSQRAETPSQTPSHGALPSRALFASNGTSSRKRQRRHTFRPSTDPSSDAPPPGNDAREGFVPRFLTAKSGSGAPPPAEAPAEEEDDFRSTRDEASAFSQNLVSAHWQRQSQQRKAESSSTGKAGYFVQRLRSLRGADAHAATKLRGATHSLSASRTNSAFLSRKRRRSGGDGAGGRAHSSSSTLDVTVAGPSAHAVTAMDPLAWGRGRTRLPAYVHRCSSKEEPNDHHTIHFPCYAWILVSQEGMRDLGVGDGHGTKQLRLHNAVVIPPRGGERHPPPSTAAEGDERHGMPTIVCAQCCEDYAAETLPLPDISFDQFA